LNELKGYFLVILSSCLVSVIASSACHEKMRKATESVLGICLLFALVAPLPQLIGGLYDLSEDFPGTSPLPEGEIYKETAEEAMCRGIALAVAEEFDCSSEGVSVKLYGFSLSDMSAQRISIILSADARFLSPFAVREYIEENFSGRCTVEILI